MYKILLILLLILNLTQSQDIHIDNETRTFRDAYERNLVFHGVNVVYKIPPYIPE